VGKLPVAPERKSVNPTPRPASREPAEPVSAAVARRVRELVGAPAGRQAAMLKELRDAKGVEHTEVLAGVIPRLPDGPRRKAQDALAERLTRMKPKTLARYLDDEDREIRLAAALACGMKDTKELVPDLILALRDKDTGVALAAHAALEKLTGQKFGPGAITEWTKWWKEHR
jgi:HEAT repeat protein